MKITLNQNTEGTTPKDLLGEWTIKGWTKDSDTECTIHLERDVQAHTRLQIMHEALEKIAGECPCDNDGRGCPCQDVAKDALAAVSNDPSSATPRDGASQTH